MNSSPSPPQHVRHQSLTPESPRPQNVPSPANIPILEQQMDPSFHDNTAAAATTTTTNHHNTNTNNTSNSSINPPTAAATASAHLAPPAAPPYAHAQHVEGFAPGGFAQAMAYAAQDTSSMHNFGAHSDATQAPGPALSSAYPFALDNAYAAQQAPIQSAPGTLYQTEGHVGASVDVQALLDSLTPAATNAPTATSLPSVAGLPPRPPAQDKPTTHPNYDPNDDIRSFHPHSQQPPATGARRQDYAQLPSQVPPAPGTAQHLQLSRSETPDDEDIRWPPEINRKYEAFLEQERKFVTEGQWDQFPMGSRLFIGNLPTEKVTKRDIFHRFYRHGALAQISIKQAYGFVQFLDAESCRRALDAEQGQAVRGRKMHLEVSKPQKNSRKAENPNPAPRRRSRSPDYTRGGTGPSPRDGRYNSGPMSPRDRDRDRDRRFRDRDDYRPMRSPSPRNIPRGLRSRDRSRDRYDTRYRSRSRTPPRRRRSPSPRQDYTEDGLDLRRRLPHEVPDIQILVLNENLSRDFIRYVEDMFRRQNLRSNVLVMSGRFPEPAVVRRQILEGVLAIVRLDTSGFAKGKVSVQIFDRRGGANNVQFNEYADLDPTTAALLVNNAKHTQSQAVQPPAPNPVASFGFNRNMPTFPQQPANPFPGSTTNQPNISNIITSLDPASLSQLLGAMSGSNTSQTTQPAPALNADIARLLAQVSTPAQTPGYGAVAQSQLPQLGQFPGLASLFANQPQPAAPPVQTTTQSSNTPDMSDIMAQLAQYQRG